MASDNEDDVLVPGELLLLELLWPDVATTVAVSPLLPEETTEVEVEVAIACEVVIESCLEVESDTVIVLTIMIGTTPI